METGLMTREAWLAAAFILHYFTLTLFHSNPHNLFTLLSCPVIYPPLPSFPQLRDPRWKDPHFRFGTILHGNTDALLKQNFPEMHHYMLKYNKSSVVEGIKAVKSGSVAAVLGSNPARCKRLFWSYLTSDADV